MKRDFLKELGFEDDVIDKIMAEHGKSVHEHKVKADKVDGLESQIADYQGQLEDRDKQLQKLGDEAKGNEELTQQIDALKQENDTAKAEYEEKLNQQAFDHTLERALSGANPRKGKDGETGKSLKAIKSLLDMEKIKLDGDTLLGLDDQLNSLKENDSYLFESEEQTPPTPNFVNGGNANGTSNSDPVDPFAAKMAKYN
ncbi:phage scaffolding protein [Alkalicoccobacillus porphyridii]|uniref:Scaffolding protein n=1 Tax=Alkalicoccobacillus porphyridii TaxID=2597270 RepID=A0A554A0B2_9BACI|nr:phage scaffolding protein [Alkalicoccobacillus porphyridii]TSB47130.1 hypothetical protein FN960_08955 [Alkalicoccobacillus porphyridii]